MAGSTSRASWCCKCQQLLQLSSRFHHAVRPVTKAVADVGQCCGIAAGCGVDAVQKLVDGLVAAAAAFTAHQQHLGGQFGIKKDGAVQRFSREALHSAILFDAELAAEMLLVSSERCRSSNQTINQLLDGIDATARGDAAALADICNSLRNGPDSMVEAAAQLEQLLTLAAPRRPGR